MSNRIEAQKVSNPYKTEINEIRIQGFKSLNQDCRIAIHPLTILAGANSSGKSSALQPFLMLKQTLEAEYDPGPLLIDGPNVRFTSTEQFLCRAGSHKNQLKLGISFTDSRSFDLVFSRTKAEKLGIRRMSYSYEGHRGNLWLGMPPEALNKNVHPETKAFGDQLSKRSGVKSRYALQPNRCFLSVRIVFRKGMSIEAPFPHLGLAECLRSIIHVRGLRGTPERNYALTSAGPQYAGAFENYVATVVNTWGQRKDKRLRTLCESLRTLGLSSIVRAVPLDDVQVELRVGRVLERKVQRLADTVSIADVGLGVSQVLPVLVALIAAHPGQLVYLEQPEIHLHPKAQIGLAKILVDAASRGVRVVTETHSDILILAIRALVAEKAINADKVVLHWFERDKSGLTRVRSSQMEPSGATPKWPSDFADLSLGLSRRYLDAAERHLRTK